MGIPGLSTRIADALEVLRKSQREAARLAGVTHSALNQAARPDADPRAETLLKFADALGLSLDWLLRGTLPMMAGAGTETIVREAREEAYREIAREAGKKGKPAISPRGDAVARRAARVRRELKQQGELPTAVQPPAGKRRKG